MLRAIRSKTRAANFATILTGVVLAGAVDAAEFRAELLFQPVDIRNIETPAAGVEGVVLSILLAEASSETTAELDGGTGSLYGTSIAPAGDTPHVFGYSSFRAADGSELYLLFEGVPARAAPDKVGRGTWSVVGATEGFEGAIGSGDYTFTVTDAGPLQTFTGELSW